MGAKGIKSFSNISKGSSGFQLNQTIPRFSLDGSVALANETVLVIPSELVGTSSIFFASSGTSGNGGNQSSSNKGTGNPVKPTQVITDHSSIPSTNKPNAIVDYIGKDGKVNARLIYDDAGRMIKQINPNNHGNPKFHPFGSAGEHAHDIIWNNEKIVDRITRELTSTEILQHQNILP